MSDFGSIFNTQCCMTGLNLVYLIFLTVRAQLQLATCLIILLDLFDLQKDTEIMCM